MHRGCTEDELKLNESDAEWLWHPATVRLTVFTAVTPCRLEDVHQHFGEMFCFHLHVLSEKPVHLWHITLRPSRKMVIPISLQWDPEISIRWPSLCSSNKFNIRSHYDWQQYLFASFFLFIYHVLSHYCATSIFCNARLKRFLTWPDMDQNVHCKRQSAFHWQNRLQCISLTALERSERHILRYGVLWKWLTLTKGSVKCVYVRKYLTVKVRTLHSTETSGWGYLLAQRRIAEEQTLQECVFRCHIVFVSCLTTLQEA